MLDILVLIEKSSILNDWGGTTLVEHNPRMHKVLGLMPSPA